MPGADLVYFICCDGFQAPLRFPRRAPSSPEMWKPRGITWSICRRKGGGPLPCESLDGSNVGGGSRGGPAAKPAGGADQVLLFEDRIWLSLLVRFNCFIQSFLFSPPH